VNKQILAAMREATRLTREGRLDEATALIQSALQGSGVVAPSNTPDVPPDDDIIEGEFRITEPTPDAAAPPAPRDTSAAALPLLTPPAGGQSVAPPHGRTTSPRPRPTAPTTAPSRGGDGGRFLSGTYTNQVDTRPYKLYIPSGYHGQSLPLVVMLHGCTQTPDDFATGTHMNLLGEEQNCLVVYPAQVPAANPSTCWNWFSPANQRRDRGEPALIAGITRQIGVTHAVDPQRIFVAGLSAGGAMAVIMGITYPELYAAVGCHSGLAYAAAHDLPSAIAAMSRAAKPRASAPKPAAPPGARALPLIVFHGDQDTTVHLRNADQLIAQWMALPIGDTPASIGAHKPKATVQHGQVAGGYAYTQTRYPDAGGQVWIERWLIHGAGHGWSGGSPQGSFTVPRGPDAAREMLRFFLAHPQREG
jgi:poly(hydroxyalkanoate) depolymerase family esterase